MDAVYIDDLISGIRDIYGDELRQIILYGSTARGEAESDSDIDIAVIVSDDSREQSRRLSDFSCDLDLKYDKVFSLLGIPADRFHQWGEALPFYRNIRSEGITLWTAAA